MTLNTQIYTFLHGRFVGRDNQGNRFYENSDGKRRWVIFNGEIEASRVAPEWHGWLHHTWEKPPTLAPCMSKKWEKPRLPNLTGTEEAYMPPGSVHHDEPIKYTDYEAWKP